MSIPRAFAFGDRWRRTQTPSAATCPPGTVAGTLRRPGHDLDAVRAAYDAPFTGYESKAGARRFPWCIPFGQPVEGGAEWQQRCYSQLPDLGLAVHFVWGDADPVFPFSQAEEWAATIPGSTLDRIEGAGHFVQEDAPEDCVTAILARISNGRTVV